MRQFLTSVCATLACLAPLAGAGAAEPVRIGMITTLSGGGSSLGIDVRDGFMLAVEQGNGKLGGVPVKVDVEDDARKSARAVQIAERMIQRDGTRVVTGIIWSNLALAVVPRVLKADAFYISPNAGPSQFAGADCHKNYFNVAWQNDNLHEAVGKYMSDQGRKSAYLLAPNYPAGKDALAGFKRYYKGKVVGEVYTTLGQLDYAAELAALREAKPDAVYFFLPGGMGINFIKQYGQAGLKDSIPLYGPAFSFDEGILSATGEAALGVINASQWSNDLDTPANRAFVEAFSARYNRRPSLYASQGYDAARLIGSALAAVDGNVDRAAEFRKALERAEFESVRGKFRFNNNHHPIQNVYVREVYRTADGTLSNRIVATAFEDHRDAYAGKCSMTTGGN
ncbi:MAG: ABC transporter substrate-binding protein [Gammaproteobacteria bacterium]|nr:ABC transporter substrate-binding protein [Gammaproteobacteria bacterium]